MLPFCFPFSDWNMGSKMLLSKKVAFPISFQSENGKNIPGGPIQQSFPTVAVVISTCCYNFGEAKFYLPD